MKNLIKLVLAAVMAAFIFPMVAISEEGPSGFSIGIVANDMDLEARGTETEGINSPSSGTKGLDKDDVAGYKEIKSFDFPSAFVEYTTGEQITWTVGLEHIPGQHALSKKSRTDSADSNTTGNDSDHGTRTAVAEVSDLTTIYFEPGIQFGDYIGIYAKAGGTHLTLDITQTGNNARYKDRDVWGGVYGAGVKLNSPWGLFVKLETLETRFRTMTWNTTNNRVRAKTEMSSTRLAIGYNF